MQRMYLERQKEGNIKSAEEGNKIGRKSTFHSFSFTKAACKHHTIISSHAVTW
jgi:hypothetical protein